MVERLLFDPPAARTTDPATSFKAAEDQRRSGRAGRHREIVLSAVLAYPGLTYRELADKIKNVDLTPGLERHEVARRLSDLEHAGLVEKGATTVCRIGNRSMTTWWPKDSASRR